MRLIFLGTSPALASAEQDHVYLLVDGPAGFWLVDCGGSSAHKLLGLGYDPLQLRGLILTHGHADHIYGLPVFIQDMWLRGRQDPLPVYANAATIERSRKLLDLFMQPRMCDFVQFHALSDAPRSFAFETDDFKLFTSPTIHSFPCHALRFEPKGTASRVMVYSADTAPTAAVANLARGADLLIHEATVLETVSVEIGHSTAAEAASIAAEAGVGELWLVHSHPWLHRDPQTYLHDAEKLFKAKITVARDGDEILF